MILLRKLLFPFAILYGIVTAIRNFFYDHGIFKSYRFDIPIIAVGNLAVGGTGKSPMVELLISLLTSDYKIATLSRGYKRKSKGFVIADEHASADILGDEPYQFYSKFSNITVAVDANRKNGIEKLLEQPVKPEVILLDDAFQHRRVKAGFYILLTAFDEMYVDDNLVPTGNLREAASGSKRADIIVVTKCPPNLPTKTQEEIRRRLKLQFKQELYFSFVEYDAFVYSQDEKIAVSEIKSEAKVLLAGIAKPAPFFNYLRGENDIILKYPDHHNFNESDIITIQNKSSNNKIITTEKDYVRLKGSVLANQLYYLPIKSTFLSGSSKFDKSIINYVGTSTRNR